MNYSKGRKIYIALSAILLIAVLVTIFILSAQNGQESSSTSGWVVELLTAILGSVPSESTIRTLAHFCEYAGLGFIFANFIFSIKNKPAPIFSVLASSGYAVTDEIHQYFVPDRACQLSDWLVDTCGVVVGVTAFCILVFIVSKIQKTKQIGHNKSL